MGEEGEEEEDEEEEEEETVDRAGVEGFLPSAESDMLGGWVG